MISILGSGKGEPLGRSLFINAYIVIWIHIQFERPKILSLDAWLLQEYAELMHEFMTAVKQFYGEKVLIQVLNNSPRNDSLCFRTIVRACLKLSINLVHQLVM